MEKNVRQIIKNTNLISVDLKLGSILGKEANIRKGKRRRRRRRKNITLASRLTSTDIEYSSRVDRMSAMPRI